MPGPTDLLAHPILFVFFPERIDSCKRSFSCETLATFFPGNANQKSFQVSKQHELCPHVLKIKKKKKEEEEKKKLLMQVSHFPKKKQEKKIGSGFTPTEASSHPM